jgi:hypothetical protein
MNWPLRLGFALWNSAARAILRLRIWGLEMDLALLAQQEAEIPRARAEAIMHRSELIALEVAP